MQPWLNLHGHQLLEEEFAGVGDLDLADVFCRIAPSAEILAFEKVRFAEETTSVADVHSVAVRHIKEALFEEARGAMRDHAVTLHLSESETAIPGTTFCGLSRQDLSRTSASRMNLSPTICLRR